MRYSYPTAPTDIAEGWYGGNNRGPSSWFTARFPTAPIVAHWKS
jgi:hypothetical protein